MKAQKLAITRNCHPERSEGSAAAFRPFALLSRVQKKCALLTVSLSFLILPCAAQTLADELRAAQVPAAGFSAAELAKPINGIHAVNGMFTWVTYVRVGKDDLISGPPAFVRYDSSTGLLLRRDMPAGDAENCCGSPLDFFFTHSYAIVEYHNTPSASTALVVDHDLQLVEILYGFGFHEVAPDQVVFTENMIHFAPAQPERLRFVDLASGQTQELYPMKGDVLRAAFVHLVKKHMPSPKECEEANQPCEPGIFDETIGFVSGDANRGFTLNAALSGISLGDAKDEAPSEEIDYTYRLVNGTWRYCERQVRATDASGGSRIESPSSKSCTPNRPAVGDPSAGMSSPFPAIIRKEK